MESETYPSSSSSSTSSSSSRSSKDCTASLHAVRKATSGGGIMIKKPPMTQRPMKMHIAPFPPMKTKVYKVKSAEFKQVVQKLTGRVGPVDPPPINLDIIAPHSLTMSSDDDQSSSRADNSNCLSPLSAVYKELMNNAATTDGGSWFSDYNIISPATTTSPWFSIPFQSPGTTFSSVLDCDAATL